MLGMLLKMTAEKRLANLEAELAKLNARQAARDAKREAARANPATRFSEAARYKPPPLMWQAKELARWTSLAAARAWRPSRFTISISRSTTVRAAHRRPHRP